jgi:hypothetical protein
VASRSDRPTLERRVRESFPTFSGGQPEITVETLEAAMTKLGRPVSSLVAKEMLDEADSVKVLMFRCGTHLTPYPESASSPSRSLATWGAMAALRSPSSAR